MTDTVIKVENLSKEYRLGVVGHDTLYRDLQSWWAKIRGKEDPNSLLTAAPGASASSPQTLLSATRRKGLEDNELKKHFLALNDVSFDVKQGEVLGIIGRNGAGKSTLLKVLSRITSPTAGEIKIKGRMASLLEVGTGFHPEMTGRENVYMNGAILGMRRREIAKKMDEIINFAELEKFIDTPVKRYSSGMYVRLAFAVAASLDAEILLLDEVLAVGDAQFQKKCLGKMDDVAKNQGRTVLFVSHNMNAIEQLCSRVVLLQKGQIKVNSSEVGKVTQKYLFGESKEENKIPEWQNSGQEFLQEEFIPKKISLVDKNGKRLNTNVIANNQDVWVEVAGEVLLPNEMMTVGYALINEQGEVMYWSYQTDTNQEFWPKLNKGMNVIRSKFPKNILNEGAYRMELISSIHFKKWITEPARNAPGFIFNIQGGLSESPYWVGKRGGLIAPIISWEKIV